ncbi:MAG: DUF551 domain-containing protein [Polynucleobacter sp.]
MSGWQPIETAPRDVPIVGLRRYPVGFQPACVGTLYEERFVGQPAIIDRWSGKWWPVTHWMPLPAPPASVA